MLVFNLKLNFNNRYGLVWLGPIGLNYGGITLNETLMMRREHQSITAWDFRRRFPI